MNTWFVDANVFLRFITVDDRGQHERAARLFSRAMKGEVRLVCGPPVLFELSWTLRAVYKVSREKVQEILSAVYSMPGLFMTDAHLMEAALTLAATALDSECDGVGTFNRNDFAKMKIKPADFDD